MPRSDANDADEVLGLLGNAAHQELELELETQPSFAHRHTDDLGITSQSPYDTTSSSHDNNLLTSSPQSLSPSPSPAPATAAHRPLPLTSIPRASSASPAPDATPSPALGANGKPALPRRQSSLAQPRPDGTPRTPNRVRFDEEAELIPLEEHFRRSNEGANNGGRGPARYHNVGGGPRQHPYATRMPLGGDSDSDEGGDDRAWADEEDFLSNGAAGGRGRRGRRSNSNGGRGGREQRLPLLTDIEAPSVTVANSDVGFAPEDLLESARPKSGLRSAFMNMANSIMYVLEHPLSFCWFYFEESWKVATELSGTRICLFLVHVLGWVKLMVISLLQQWRWHHWSTLRFQASRSADRYSSPCGPDRHRRLDDPPHSREFEAQWSKFVPSNRATLLRKFRLDSHKRCPVGFVSGPSENGGKFRNKVKTDRSTLVVRLAA